MKPSTRSDIGPFAIVPLWLIKSGISPGAVVTFALMWAEWGDREGKCWPSHSSIATQLDVSERTIIRHLAELEAIGAVEVVRRQRDDGSQTSNLYLLRSVQPRDISVRGGGQELQGGSDESVTGGLSWMSDEPYPEEPDPLNPSSSAPSEPTDKAAATTVEGDSDSEEPESGTGLTDQGSGSSYQSPIAQEVSDAEAILIGEGHDPKDVRAALYTGAGEASEWTHTNRRYFPAETLAEAVRLAVEFSDACDAAGNKRPNPYTNRAINPMRLLLVNDKKEPRHIRALIAWTFNDHFWYCNVLSTSKFRERWDQLAGRRRDDLKKSRVQQDRDKGATGEDWMARTVSVAR